jgi:membrane protein DedA with SNARE-associated domain
MTPLPLACTNCDPNVLGVAAWILLAVAAGWVARDVWRWWTRRRD